MVTVVPASSPGKLAGDGLPAWTKDTLMSPACLVPPLSLITCLVTTSVPGWSSFVIVHVDRSDAEATGRPYSRSESFRCSPWDSGFGDRVRRLAFRVSGRPGSTPDPGTNAAGCTFVPATFIVKLLAVFVPPLSFITCLTSVQRDRLVVVGDRAVSTSRRWTKPRPTSSWTSRCCSRCSRRPVSVTRRRSCPRSA